MAPNPLDFSGKCVIVTGGTASGAGTFTYTATATDKAGNKVTTTGTYKVVYRFDGFLQPINDTAHQVGTSTSVFKAGSTVPAKLQLKKADQKHSRYTLNVSADDRNIEKKDKNLDEPVQFYTGKDPVLYEVVVNSIEKNKVSGYLSTPKSGKTATP